MLAQHRGVDAAILLQAVAELRNGQGLGGRSRQRAGDHLDQEIGVGGCHAGVKLLRAGPRGLRIFRRCFGALQDVQIERREAFLVEAHRPGAVRQFPFEIGAAPIDHGHEIVTDDLDAGGGDRLEARDPGLDRARCLGPEPLDVIGDRNRFHHRPGQLRTSKLAVLDDVLALLDARSRPGLADRNLMQRGDHVRCAGLADIVERNRIVRPVPPPSLQHHGSSPEVLPINAPSVRP